MNRNTPRHKPAGQLLGPLLIETLANGGSGIVREGGRVIFVPGAFPGDLVLCRVLKEKKNYAEAEVVELSQPSSLRRNPPCPIADECGGCQWQQLPYAEQLRWKQQLFAATLTRQVGADAALIQPIVAAPAEFEYRSRVQIKCFHSKDGFITGFFRPKSRFVVNVEHCPLMAPQLNQLLAKLKAQLSVSPFARKISQIDLAIGSDNSLCSVVHLSGNDNSALSAFLLPLAEQFDFACALQVGRQKKLMKVRGRGDLSISVDHPAIDLHYATGGFAQINLEQNRSLVQAVLAAADLRGDEQVLDLYCGMGNFSLPLARRAGQVTGVEDFAPSIAMARRNAVDNGIENVDFHTMSADKALMTLKKNYDLLVLDPPRAGAYSLVKQLSADPIGKIIYVSCDPQTLARDLKYLTTTGYQLISSQAFDMFPQTYHVESISVLEYRSA